MGWGQNPSMHSFHQRPGSQISVDDNPTSTAMGSRKWVMRLPDDRFPRVPDRAPAKLLFEVEFVVADARPLRMTAACKL